MTFAIAIVSSIIALGLAVICLLVIKGFQNLLRIEKESIKTYLSLIGDTTNRQVSQAKEISSLLNQQQKLVNLFNKTKKAILDRVSRNEQLTIGIGNSHRELIATMDNFIEQAGINFQDLFCELYEDSCEECPFHTQCIDIDRAMHEKYGTTDPEIIAEQKESEPEYESSVAQLPYSDPADLNITGNIKEGEIEVDPNNPKCIEQIIQVMTAQGIPLEAAQSYAEQIKSVLKPGMKLKWATRKIITNPDGSIPVPVTPPGHPRAKCNNTPKEEDSSDKLIDPKSKIVKTLNNLYKK